MPRIALISGCSSGIGWDLCISLASNKDVIVYATSRNPTKLKALVESHKNIFALQLDVTNSASIAKCVSSIIEQHGKIDILVNNAGLGAFSPAADTNLEIVHTCFSTNVVGLIALTNEVFPHMASHRSGKIVNIGSVACWNTLPFGSIYSASKAAVESYTDGLRVEVAPFGVQVMLVAPGAIQTSFANNARSLFHVTKDGPFEPFRALVEQRVKMSQGTNSMPSRVFCDRLARQIMKPRIVRLFCTGGYSTFLYFLWYAPKFLKDWIVERMFGLKKVILP